MCAMALAVPSLPLSPSGHDESRGSGGEAHARGAMGVSPHFSPLSPKRAEQRDSDAQRRPRQSPDPAPYPRYTGSGCVKNARIMWKTVL